MWKCTQKKAVGPSTRKGIAAVEFAIVLPLVLLLFFAMVEFCHAIQMQSSINNIAREAARHAITVNATNSSTELIVREGFQVANLQSGSVNVLPVDTQAASPGTLITVTATAPLAENSIGIMRFLSNFDISATVVMRKE